MMAGGSKKVRARLGTCSTDVFTVSGNTNIPPLCSTLTDEHVYFDVTSECHDLDFSFGQHANGVTKSTTRKFSIKVWTKFIYVKKSYYLVNPK